MAIVSMTGFARAEGRKDPCRWTWEIRSVNGRNLDLRVRVPSGFEALEPDVRKRVGARLKRGAVQIGLQFHRDQGASELTLNEAALEQVLGAIERLGGTIKAAPPSLDGILSLRGVLEQQEPDETEEDLKARNAAILESFDTALDALVDARRQEGKAIAGMLGDLFGQVDALVSDAEKNAALMPEKLKARLKEQVDALLEASDQRLPEDRLAQEAAVLITKADVREEIDRLRAHLTAAREITETKDVAGRRLDFLMQEFNREANTLCAKSADMELTRIGLELKVVIDQLREQVQNVE